MLQLVKGLHTEGLENALRPGSTSKSPLRPHYAPETGDRQESVLCPRKEELQISLKNMTVTVTSSDFNEAVYMKCVRILGKFRTGYGASLKKTVTRIEINQHAKYTCSFLAGAIWTNSPTSVVTVKSAIRTLKEFKDQWKLHHLKYC
ncbi:unnamed protein product [Nyctereutes procyonoides]|uniref:(raccoon dog) hypothetical protein n=1 Tax=Nyctereutes procyonoides TaxID=34880 RepID=A0A811Y509_NYCPR|nr:unnamed protein product [Nyctereutes procyonoides]